LANEGIIDDTKVLHKKLDILSQTLEANNMALEEAQALTHLGSWQWDVQTGVISWSDELYRIFGLKPQGKALDYEEFLQLIHVEDRDRVNGIITEAFKTGDSFEFEHRISLPNNKIRILHGKGKSIADEDGNVIRMVGTSRDVTERKKSDQALHQSDERFRAVTAATNDVVYDINLKHNTIWFNDAMTSEYGYPKDEIEERPRWKLEHTHPEDRDRAEADARKFLSSNNSTRWECEYRFEKHDGTFIDVYDRAVVIRDAHGKPIRMIGSMLDVTKQKELERAKDKFISLVSHQLRTPLTSMRLLTEMLATGHAGELTKSQKSYINKIGISTIRMIQLVGDILNVSQIERGRLKVLPLPTDISELIQWHIDEVSPLADERNVKVKFTPSKTVDTVDVDPILFSQIVHNLLTNAIRYSTEDKIIKVAFVKKPNSYVLSVKDQGIGIPKEVRPRIFSSFYRAENAVKLHADGTGLGLYLIKLILDATGGKVWFDSDEGKGTTFYVSLPLSGMKEIKGDKTLLHDYE
jgi:PAS domain S-box-containing protein